MAGKQFLGLRAGQARAQGDGAADRVEVGEGVEATQVQGDDGREAAACRVQAADHTGAAAERDDRDALGGAVLQHREDIVVIGGEDDGVGGVLFARGAAAQQVRGGLAARAEQAVAMVDRQVLGSDHRDEPGVLFRRERRGAQRHVALIATSHRLAGHPEYLCEQSPNLLGQRFVSGRGAPGVPHHTRAGLRLARVFRRCGGCLCVDHALQSDIECQAVTELVSGGASSEFYRNLLRRRSGHPRRGARLRRRIRRAPDHPHRGGPARGREPPDRVPALARHRVPGGGSAGAGTT